jgi:tetratricopeptide (TPR) repeat protein
MSKPMVVTLPFVLLLLDYWPLERLSLKRGEAGSKYSLPYLLVEKIPLFVIVFASCIVTFVVQQKSGAMAAGEDYSFSIRLANASVSYMQYIIKMIWPVRLAMFYPHPGRNVSILYAVISAVLLLAVTIFVVRFAADRRYLVTGWFWYLGTLAPVIGLVQVGGQAMADRYSYITLTGLFIIIAWGLPDLLTRWRYKKIALALSALLIVLTMSICAHFQLRYWRNSQTLFQHALDATKDNYMAHFCIAATLREQGKLDKAIYHYSEAIRINPVYINALNGLGATLYKAGRIDEAIHCYKRAIEVNPLAVEVYVNLGTALIAKGEFAEAISLYNKALQIAPDFIELRINLGIALTRSGKFAEAIKEYEKALLIQPQNAIARNNLGMVLFRQEKLDEAIKCFTEALRINPDFAGAHTNLGKALAIEGKLDEAISHLNQAIRIDPNYTAAKNSLNLVLAEKQKLQNKDTKNKKK